MTIGVWCYLPEHENEHERDACRLSAHETSLTFERERCAGLPIAASTGS